MNAVPRYLLGIREATGIQIDPSLFGCVDETLTLPECIPDTAKAMCGVYETLLRRLFRECTTFSPDVILDGDVLGLNMIDRWSSDHIIRFLRSPSRGGYTMLYRLLRRYYSMRPEVITLIVCRNRGIPARRLASDDELESYWARITQSLGERSMHSKAKYPWREEGCEYIVVDVDGSRPIVLQGQTSPFSSATAQTLLFNKHWTATFLRQYGHAVPKHMLIEDATQLRHLQSLCHTVVFKPVIGSRRVGVVGPVRTDNPESLERCYRRCIEQVVTGPAVALAQEYIAGSVYRINVNHGKITFAFKSERNEVCGDGVSTIETLLTAKRLKEQRLEWPSDVFIDNVLTGGGVSRTDVPAVGERVVASHDATEGGTHVDITDTLDVNCREEALRVARHTSCPVVGIDIIVDAEGALWIIDVNATRPMIGNVRQRAYDTIEHMITKVMTHEPPLMSCCADEFPTVVTH